MSLFVNSRARAVALPALLLAALAGCGGGCDERFVVDSESPNGYTIATVYVRDCGLGAESQTHVNLRPREEKFRPDASGVVKDGEVFTVAGHRKVYAIWKDERNLTIRCEGCGTNQVFKSESMWKSVSISFVEK
ncbi:MAG TPA: hypothetical protein VEX60_01190 [Pyrinomonadaceae bacterium]|nr:hypothetical protein [Pyrinomonadaceae bacterium]